MVEITREMFIAYTGFEPVDDDLERCNCKNAGDLGHFHCGWNKARELPQFMTAPYIKPEHQPKG
jgi:hypothetical protein